MKLEEFLKRLRLGYNMNQVDMAEAMHLSYTTYSFLESGKCKPSYKTVKKISEFSGLPVKEVRSMIDDN